MRRQARRRKRPLRADAHRHKARAPFLADGQKPGAAYNRAMRASPLLLLLALATGPALAQNTSQNPPEPNKQERDELSKKEQKSDRLNQRIERLHIEDGGSRVDEVRVGGQTQSITVQPKVGGMPEYEVQPSDGVRNRPRNGAETDTGSRVWNLKKF